MLFQQYIYQTKWILNEISYIIFSPQFRISHRFIRIWISYSVSNHYRNQLWSNHDQSALANSHTLYCIYTWYTWLPCLKELWLFNTLMPRQNGRHFADDIFKCIFVKENVWILIKISLKFVPKGPIYNIPAFVQIMAWRRAGDKPFSVLLFWPVLLFRTPEYIWLLESLEFFRL